jgi:hypothetical protein
MRQCAVCTRGAYTRMITRTNVLTVCFVCKEKYFG